MLASILTTLLGAGAALAAPAGQSECSSRASRFKEWKVLGFDFHASYIFTTPAHQNSWGYASFRLETDAMADKFDCRASSDQLNDFFYGTVVYTCNGTTPGSSATFKYSRPANQLNLTQEWSCPAEGSRYTAEGCATLPLKCSDCTSNNPTWKPGQIYSDRTVKCDPLNVKVPVLQMSAVA